MRGCTRPGKPSQQQACGNRQQRNGRAHRTQRCQAEAFDGAASQQRPQADACIGRRDIQGSGQRLCLRRCTHHPHLAQRKQRGVGHAPDRQRDERECSLPGQPDAAQHAQRQYATERQGRTQWRAIHPAAAQRVADQSNRTEAHQPPPHLCGRNPQQPFEYIGQIGIGSEHGGEHQHRQQHIALQPGLAQHACLFAQRAPRPGNRIGHPQR